MNPSDQTPQPEPTGPVSKEVFVARIQRALRELQALTIAVENIAAHVSAAEDALNYVRQDRLHTAGLRQEAADLTRAKIAVAKALAIIRLHAQEMKPTEEPKP